MKTLFLMRHAKSSWEDKSLSDFERPLNERGRRTVPFMGELMRQRGLSPASIMSSPAVRAAETAMAVKNAAMFDAEIVFDPGIYEASPNDLRKVVLEMDEGVETAMIVGHNPGLEGFIYYLTGGMEPMPTAALAVIELDTKWSEIEEGAGRLATVIRPKDEMQG